MDELADRVHGLRLAALEMPDEVPAEGVAVDRVLRLEILRAVLANDLDSGLGEDRQLLDRDVLRRRDDRDRVADLGADALVTLPNLVRRQRYASSLVGKRSVSGTGFSSRYRTSPATEASTPCTPLGFPSRRCE